MEYQIHFHDGHPIIHTEQDRILIDTGSPSTFHDEGQLSFMGQTFRAFRQQVTLNMDVLRRMTGTDITALMGMDIMGRFGVAFRYAEGKIIFDPALLTARGTALHSDQVMGIPIISVDICNARRRVFLDTGAKLSYLHDGLTAGLTSEAIEEDFYPGFGHFQTPVFALQGAVGGRPFNGRFGNLPASLRRLLSMGNAEGILGSDFLHQFNVGIDARQQLVFID